MTTKETGKITVVNVKHAAVYHYVGRGAQGHKESALGNPYRITDYNDAQEREDVIEKYRHWLWTELKKESSPAKAELMKLVERVKEGKEVRLGCHCTPKPCHAEVIKRAIEWMLSKEAVK